jgi:thiol-disulfide isomerase/thioredoxin
VARFLLFLALVGGCGDDAPPPPPRGRVLAVKGPARPPPDLDAFCDVRGARTFDYPPLTSDAPPPTGGWVWVNVWATWCAPCVEEIPRLVEFQRTLGEDGRPVTLRFLSIDESDDVVARYRASHPALPPTMRVADPAAVGGWVGTTLGVDASALPIHVFVDRELRTRCVRTGAIGADHYEAVRALLATGS